MLTNPFPHGKHMTQDSMRTDGGIQGPPSSSIKSSIVNIYMLKFDAFIETRAHDYGKSESVEKGKEVVNPYVPLHIEKTMGETMTHISKGVFKKDSHNPNMRASHNYSVVEDLSQTPCVRSSLDVLWSCHS
jgi:hypothetical protein